METYMIYLFLGSFLALSALIYSNLLMIQFFGLRFGWNDKQMEDLMLAMLVLSLAFLWYSISLSFTLYNKWLLQEWHSGFNFPILITTVHMIMKYIITRLWALSPEAEPVPAVPWKVHASVVIPIGICTSADIVLSNIAIYYLPLSMVTVIKGSTAIFTYLLGVICKVEDFRWSLFGAVLCIMGGLGMAILNSGDELSGYGLTCVILASMCSAVRWVLVQVLALQDAHSHSVMVTLYRFSPYSMLSILPFALLFEAPDLVKSGFGERPVWLGQALAYCVVGGVVSFLLIIAEVKLLRVTSSLTMCVIGQIKEIIQIGVAMLLFKDHVTLRSGAGIVISILAAYCYRHLKSSDEGGSDIEERNATMQILQSSQLAHRSVRHSYPHNNNSFYEPGTSTMSGMYANSTNGYVGVDTEYNVPHSAIEDEIESLLFDELDSNHTDFDSMNTHDDNSGGPSNNNGNSMEIEMAPLNGSVDPKDMEV